MKCSLGKPESQQQLKTKQQLSPSLFPQQLSPSFFPAKVETVNCYNLTRLRLT